MIAYDRGASRCSRIPNLLLVTRSIVFAMLLICIPSGCVTPPGEFGIEGIRYFSNVRANGPGIKKADDFSYTFNRCNGVYHALKKEYFLEFYHANKNVHERHLRSSNKGGIDDKKVDWADLIYFETHGSRSDNAMLLLFNNNVDKWIGDSRDWELGNVDLEWLAIYACDLIDRDTFGDKGYGRYHRFFHGLHMILTAWNGLWDGWTTDECGEDFANNLLDGDSMKNAWFDGVSDWWCDQDPAVISAEVHETWNGGKPFLNQTTLFSDHFHGKGKVCEDIAHEDVSWIGFWWVDD